MAQEREFSHITVTPHEEKEVVIHVGAPSSAQPSEPAENTPDVSQSGATGLRELEQGQSTVSSAPASEVKKTAPASEMKKNRTQNSYQETTLEDLERQPMPLTQKIVLVAAVLLLVGFVVYYFFLR